MPLRNINKDTNQNLNNYEKTITYRNDACSVYADKY